jgi:cephalosporin-C deacetylase-like acetyl esterase
MIPRLLAFLLVSCSAFAGESETIASLLSRSIIDSNLPLAEIQAYTESRVPVMPQVSSVDEWEKVARKMRQETLDKVVFRGEAAKWRKQKTRVEWFETIPGGPGYHIRKLRYEAVPGMWIPALLYVPDDLAGKVPVSLAVNGHEGVGKSVAYKQLRCINMVKRGMIVLNTEWIGMGQLRGSNYAHYCMNQIDLCGTSGLAPFYLAMSRGLDVLLAQKNADPARVIVSGLSGGGWQTIFISSLDERVTLANPVAGYSSFRTRARYVSDLGDSEQTPNDLATVTDYAHLTAMRAPRPTLLTFNATDNCCFASPHAMQPLVDAAAPIFKFVRTRGGVAHTRELRAGRSQLRAGQPRSVLPHAGRFRDRAGQRLLGVGNSFRVRGQNLRATHGAAAGR